MRFLSLTFDDGLYESAVQADRLLGPVVTFYIVTGWVTGAVVPADPWNAGRDHGTLAGWRRLAEKGHDVQSHTLSHHPPKWYATATPEAVRRELWESYETVRTIHAGPYSLATPYHRVPTSPHPYAAVRLGPGINKINSIDWQALACFGARKGDVAAWAADNLPAEDGVWVIPCLHGLDGEGYCPWTSGQLVDFVGLARRRGYALLPVKDVMRRLRPKML